MKNRDDRDLVEATERVERAKKYAKIFPVSPGDLKFQTVDWQLAQVKRFNAPCAPPKS